MDHNIFKALATDKKPPDTSLSDLMNAVEDLQNGEELAELFNTPFYGQLLNFFKLKTAREANM
ncbi:hypothetical protein [Robiginitalea sp. IMCC43444]|uniref:hypothetical protein n=1 Tax=Robiginitalea sp. IMCC43444 TaxID=3459121 RepID=UPI00404119B1